MKKTLFTFALMALMLVFTAGSTGAQRNIDKGSFAPELKLANESSSITLSQLRGNYVLLTFWSSADAQSRIDCNKYSAWFDANQPSGLRHVAVNFDSEAALFSAIAQRDKLDGEAQYNVTGKEASRIVSDYGLANGLGSVLIGPDGRIVEFNPATTDLTTLI